MSSKVEKYFNYVLSERKRNFIFEEKSDDEEKEDKSDYKKNVKINVDKSTDLSYKTYVTLFVEALNSLDAMASIAIAIDPDFGPAKKYNSDRYQIAVIDQSTPDGIQTAWDKMKKIAGGSGKGLYSVVQNSVLKNDAVKKYQEEKKKLDNQKKGEDGKQITDEYYAQELSKLKEKYSSLIDQTKVLTLSKLAKALSYYIKAIEKFEEGAKGEISYVEKSESDLDSFCEKVSDAISNIILSKKPDEKKLESYNYIETDKHVIDENLGGFLKQSSDFATGIVNPKAFTRDDKAPSVDKASILYSAENLKGLLLSAASEIDNVINFKKNISGEADGSNVKGDRASSQTAEKAKKGASEMIEFIKKSFVYVTKDINDDLENPQVTLKEITAKLDDIAKTLKIYRRPDGPLDQWKNEVLGEPGKGEGRGRIVSAGNLQKGRELMGLASELVSEVTKSQDIKKQVDSIDANKVLKKAVDAFKGVTSDDKEYRIRTRNDVKTFQLNGEQDKNIIKEFQQRLIDLGHLPSGTPSGVYDKETKKATKIAMTHVGDVSGRVYNDSEQAFIDFQKDLGIYAEKKEEIRKNLGF